MIAVSGRYALPLLASLLLALAPVALNSWGSRARDDCADPAALLSPPEIPRVEEWLERDKTREHYFQWTEGAQEHAPGRPRIKVHTVRAYATAALLLQPQIFVGAQNERYDRRLEWIDADGESLPIRMRRAESPKRVDVVAYLYVYGGRPQAHPLRAVLASAPRRMLSGPRPITLYWVEGTAAPERADRLDRQVQRWLARAWQQYAEVCSP